MRTAKRLFVFAIYVFTALSLTFSSSPIAVRAMSQPVGFPTLTAETDTSLYLPVIRKPASDWTMAGANPERTSWVSEQVDGSLNPIWYKQFEAYIPLRVQIITAYSTLYVATSAGLYALDSNSGAQKWVYPTAMPLGDSPTVDGLAVYVGGLDHKLHAIDALTGKGLWQFEAGNGFTTNPLVVGGVVYAGNRDGYFYAIHAQGTQVGQLAWKYKTDGPIDYSAAYKDGVIFFASNDSYAYALNAQTGALVWKSDKLPGSGFHAWWPVVYRDWVIFAGSTNYRPYIAPGIRTFETGADLVDVYKNYQTDPRGTPIGPVGQAAGDWVAKTCTIDTSRPTVTSNGASVPVTEYLETKPWRRTYFVLNRYTGKEYTTDFDHDGKPEYAPVLWQGTHDGNRYPPIVGNDGVIYQANNYMSSAYIAGGQVTGWEIGTPYISIISKDWKAVDEPYAYSAGGNRIYWNHVGDRGSGSYDISIPNPIFPPDLGSGPGYCSDANRNTQREILYFNYDLNSRIPGYYTRYTNSTAYSQFGGADGAYGYHGEQNPPIPYQGKLYMHRSNAVIAFGPTTASPVKLPMALKASSTSVTVQSPTLDQLKARLAQEVQKMVTAGHLRPGYVNSGQLVYDGSYNCGYNNQYSIGDYWSNPSETLYTLLRARPLLSDPLKTAVDNYIKSEFAAYPPYQITHIGWKDGAAREAFIDPPEVVEGRKTYLPLTEEAGFAGWSYNPFGFYAMWKYAAAFLNQTEAQNLFNASKGRLRYPPPADSYLEANPQVFNAYIAGYWGYLELQNLAYGVRDAGILSQRDRLLSLRASTFSKDLPDTQPTKEINYCRGLNLTRNFFYLVPEVGQYLHDHSLSQVQQALTEYNQIAPFWFVASFDAVYGEGVKSPLYNYHSLFQAKALVLQEPLDELAKYVDVPGVAVGDLFYIDNLISAIQAVNN